MDYIELTDSEFRKFEQKQPNGNFFQSAERAELRRKMGWNVYLLGVKDKKKILAACMIMERNGEAFIQIGPILDYQNKALLKFWIKSTINFAKEHNFVVLEVFPPVLLAVHNTSGDVIKEINSAHVEKAFLNAGFSYMGRTVEIENKANRWMTIKDLSAIKTKDEARASYKKNVRNKLRKITPELEIYQLKDKSEIPLVADALDDSNRKNGVVSRYLNYYEWLWDAWGDNVRFVVARRREDKEVVAGRIIVDHPNEVVCFVSGIIQRYKKLNGMTFLQDWTICDCVERGVKRLNMYGLAGDFSSKNHLLEFKSGFGVEIEEYIGGFRLVLQPGKYRINNAKKAVFKALRSIKYSVRDFIKTAKERRA